MFCLENGFLYARNNYYWSRTPTASSSGDFSKAKVFHWLHNFDSATSSGILESVKEPLEGRVWFEYPGGCNAVVGTTDQPSHIGRVLDDGQTQLYTKNYNAL